MKINTAWLFFNCMMYFIFKPGNHVLGIFSRIHYLRSVLILTVIAFSAITSADLANEYRGIGPNQNNEKKEILYIEKDESSRFVDHSSGSDSQDGSFLKPWKSIGFSIDQLKAGDTLYLRGGIYNESQINVYLVGNPKHPIAIKGYPGETVIIDGSLVEFRRDSAPKWKLINQELAIYESVNEVDPDKIYTVSVEHEDTNERLVTYYDSEERGASGIEDISAKDMDISEQPRYAGPGILNADGHLLLRLARPLDSPGITPSAIPYGNVDPAELSFTVSAKKSIFNIEGSHISFENLSLRGALKAFEIKSGSSDIEFSHISVSSVSLGFYAVGPVESIVLDQVHIDGGFPRWLAWTDMKGSSEHSKPASHWSAKVAGFSGKEVNNLIIKNSRFTNLFDGAVIGGNDIRIHNNLVNSTDDMVQLASDSSQVQIDHNLILGAGPSHNGKSTSMQPGTKYIHHNVIDSSSKILWSRHDPYKILNVNQRGVMSAFPFPRHTLRNAGKGDPWKIYNNTIVFDSSGFSTHPGYQLWGQLNTTGIPHEVYNNIFLDRGDGIFIRGLLTEQLLQNYDGNLYWTEKSKGDFKLYKNVEGSDKELRSFSLGEIQNNVENGDGKIEWDQHSKIGSPNLDENYIPQITGPLLNTGIPLPRKWPGSERQFLGAIEK